MKNTIDNETPIYDSKVAKVFKLNRPANSSLFEHKLDVYLNQLEVIKATYEDILESDKIQSIIVGFDSKFSNNNYGPVKKLDFLFWSAGKLI